MKKFLFTLLAMVAMTLTGGLSASAADFPTDGSAITLGEVYTVPRAYAANAYNAKLTVSKSGKLIQDGCPQLRLTGAADPDISFGGKYGQVSTWTVEAGKTYEITNPTWVMDQSTVVFEMDADKGVELISCKPASGEKLYANANGTGSINLNFGSNIKFSKVTMTVGTTTVNCSATIDSHNRNMLSINVQGTLNQLYANGTLYKSGGQQIEVKIEGLANDSGVLYGTDGTLTLTYTSTAKLLELVSNNVTNPFESYYPAGDTKGILNFVFDAPLASADFDIFCGNPEVEGGYYVETLPVTIDDCTGTVNLTGKLRDLQTYGTIVGLKIYNITGKDGQGALGSGQGALNSYSFSLEYHYIQPADITTEFTPATGSSLKEANEIEIWFTNSDVISYDGVQFAYDDANGQRQTIVVDKKDLTATTGSDNTETIELTIPDAVKTANNVVVTLYNEVAKDGQEHNIKAEYNMFVVKLVSPLTAGGSYASTGKDDFVFEINDSALEGIGFIRYEFYNEADEQGNDVWAYGTSLNKQEDGTWTAYNGNYTLYNNYTPKMVINAYEYEQGWSSATPVASYTITFKGTTPAFKYSDTEFVSISPSTDEVLKPAEGIVFTVKYDTPVILDATRSGVYSLQGEGTVPFVSAVPSDPVEHDGVQYSSEWKLTADADRLKGAVNATVFLYAKDMQGDVVTGNQGVKENSCMSLLYSVYDPEAYYELTIEPAAGSTVTELNVITLSYPGEDGVGMAVGIDWNYTGTETVTLSTKSRELIHEFKVDDMKVVAEQTGTDEFGNPVYSEISKIELTLPETITEPGAYVLSIPEGRFTIGAQFTVFGNKAVNAEYYIDEPKELHVLTVNPAAGSVETLSRIDIEGQGLAEAQPVDFDAPIEIKDAEGQVVFTETAGSIYDKSLDMITWEFLGFWIEPNITEKGVYTLTIPAGTFMFDGYEDEVNDSLVAVYNVSGLTGITSVVVEEADQYVVYTLGGVHVMTTANAAQLAELNAGIYVINGKKVLVK